MRVICDFHLHSKYSRATSQQMNLEGLSRGAKQKGLDILGTGDFSHPTWLAELKEKLGGTEEFGLYKYKDIYFMLTTEVSTIFEVDGKIKKIHQIIHVPSFEIAGQINEMLAKYGNLKIDGRPTLTAPAPELVEKIIEISNDVMITSAHAWTPWFSLFGSKSGFDSVEDCYQDQTKNIFSLETGLSSDPAMNWRLSSLDKFTLVSNSDSHSPNPWRLGREANVFDLKKISYQEIVDAIRKKDREKFLFTVEVDPSYGKYHFTGHRDCGINLEPKKAIELKNICPRCGRTMTIG
ncbi:MAG TPA: endonuclease Q family protein, partial [archaeon]|nr:endonuclease Q family protein [archaeon]